MRARIVAPLILALSALALARPLAAEPDAAAQIESGGVPIRPVNRLKRPWEDYARRPLAKPAPEPGGRTLDVPTETLVTRGYTHFSTISETPDGHMHVFSFFGRQHQSGAESAIVYRMSSDHGVTWSAGENILDGFGKGVEWRIGATGVTRTGRLLVMAIRIDRVTELAYLGSIHSDDGGKTWSDFAELRQSPPSPSSPKGSQMGTDAQIKFTPSGKLVMMAYLGPWNYALTSEDNGETWARTIMIKSDVTYSEMAVQPLDETTWIAVSRIDRNANSMAQFVTKDGGGTWENLGPLNLPPVPGYVMPSLNLIDLTGEKLVVLGVTDRSTGRTSFRTAPASSVANGAGAWGGPLFFATDLRVRSGYQSAVFDKTCNRFVVANHRETSEVETSLQIALVPLGAVVGALGAKAGASSASCPTFH